MSEEFEEYELRCIYCKDQCCNNRYSYDCDCNDKEKSCIFHYCPPRRICNCNMRGYCCLTCIDNIVNNCNKTILGKHDYYQIKLFEIFAYRKETCSICKEEKMMTMVAPIHDECIEKYLYIITKS